MRFIADTMLGTLARWLRVFGFDTAYARDMDDHEIISMGRRESRTIISRDRELCGRASGSILLESTELDDQIKTVLGLHVPDRTMILTRCLECNTPLETFIMDEVSLIIPDSVRESQSEFRLCTTCRKAYWKGTHYRNMLEQVERYLSHRES